MAMKKENKLKLFEKQSIRTYWDEEREKWYFSLIDVITILKKYILQKAFSGELVVCEL